MQAKEAVSRLLEQLPHDATIEDIQYHLYVLQKIQAGQAAADAGHVIPNEEVLRELAQSMRENTSHALSLPTRDDERDIQ